MRVISMNDVKYYASSGNAYKLRKDIVKRVPVTEGSMTVEKDGDQFFVQATPNEAWAGVTFGEVSSLGAKVIGASADAKAKAARHVEVEDRPTKASALDRLQSKAKSSIAKAEKEAEMAAAAKKNTAAAKKEKAAKVAASKAEVKKTKAEAKAARAKGTKSGNGEKDYTQHGTWLKGQGARTKLEAGEKPYSGKRQMVYDALMKGTTVEKLAEKIEQQPNATRAAMWDIRVQITGEGSEWDPVGLEENPKVYRLAV
jgi:hypothetical protein